MEIGVPNCTSSSCIFLFPRILHVALDSTQKRNGALATKLPLSFLFSLNRLYIKAHFEKKERKREGGREEDMGTIEAAKLLNRSEVRR